MSGSLRHDDVCRLSDGCVAERLPAFVQLEPSLQLGFLLGRRAIEAFPLAADCLVEVASFGMGGRQVLEPLVLFPTGQLEGPRRMGHRFVAVTVGGIGTRCLEPREVPVRVRQLRVAPHGFAQIGDGFSPVASLQPGGPPIVPRDGVRGIQTNGLALVADGAVVFALEVVQQSSVSVGSTAGRIGFDCLRPVGNRPLEVAAAMPVFRPRGPCGFIGRVL